MKTVIYGDSDYIISLFNQLESKIKKNIVDLMKGLAGAKQAD